MIELTKSSYLIVLAFLLFVIPMSGAQQTEKVFVIGLDGASESFMQQCMEKNDYQNIEKLVSKGSFSKMDSTLPPLTPSGMSSFLTGTDPGDHGVYGFEKRNMLDYQTSTVSSHNLENTLPESIDGKSVMINVPMTYPAKESGVVVSGFPGSTSGNYVNPPTLKKDLEERNYSVTTAGTFENEEEMEKEVFKLFKTRRELSKDYMERFEWDFFMVMFTGDARLMHFSEPDCEGAVADYYSELDTFLGEVNEKTGENTTIVLMSNHGFTELDKKMYMYTFLKDNGYLEPEKPAYWKNMVADFTGNILEKLGVKRGGEISGRSQFSDQYMEEVDWSETKAYTGGFYNGQIFINLEGREPNGVVKQEDYEKVRENIIEDLKELEDPETGEKVVENIYRKEEIYDGERMDELPDIVIETPGYNHIARFGFGETFLHNPVEKSAPVKEGFAASNRKIEDNISIVDLSSSIAELTGEDFGEGENVFKSSRTE
jgi:predicted AlkP superfamily phosphohydrolase/phosphomutase